MGDGDSTDDAGSNSQHTDDRPPLSGEELPKVLSSRAESSEAGDNVGGTDDRLREAAVKLLEAAADQVRTAAPAADQVSTAAPAADDHPVVGTSAQRAEVAAAAAGLQCKVAAPAEQLRAAADRLGIAASGPDDLLHKAAVKLLVELLKAEQLAAAGQLETAAGPPAGGTDERICDAADLLRGADDRLHEATDDVRRVRQSLTALTAADLADRAELELYLTEKKLQDTRNKLLRKPAEKSPGIVDFEEITNLVIIDRYPKLKKAHELWYQRDKDLKAKIAQKEARRSDVRNQVYNIIGWYAVYLGVVLTAVSQLTQTSQNNSVPVRKKFWFPILLTGLGVAGTILGLAVKFSDLSSLESTISDERKTSDELNRRVLELGRKGLKFNFLTEIKERRPLPTNWYNLTEKIFVCLALLAFAGVFIVSYFVILRDLGT